MSGILDTLYDAGFSGHEGDEIDILGPSISLPTGTPNPDTTWFEDEIPVTDPDTGEFLGYTNTESLPVGGDDDGETPGSGGDPTQRLILYGLALVVLLWLLRPVFETSAALAEE